MLMWVMYHKAEREVNGFSLIEVLVVLVITGLLAAVAGPNMFAALNANQRAEDIAKLRGILPVIAMNASLQDQEVLISSHQQVNSYMDEPLTTTFVFEPPLFIQNNGFCHNSTVTITTRENVTRSMYVTSPYCQLSLEAPNDFANEK